MRERTGKPRRYMIVGPAWIGDMVMAQSLYISLKQQHPDSIIDVIAPAWSLPIMKRMPEVDNTIELLAGHGELLITMRRRIGMGMRGIHSHAIVLPRSWKSALIPFFARIPVRTGYKGEMRYGLLTDVRELDKAVLTQTVQRYVALGQEDASVAPEIPHPHLMTNASNQKKLLETFSLDLSVPVIALMPGAEYGPAKQWPLPYYAELAARLIAAGYQVWVLGSEKDRRSGDVIAAADVKIQNLCGNTKLEDAVDLLAAAQQVVTNDSGLMHIAAAVGTRVNVIYGSSTPDYTPPLTTPDRQRVFYLGLDCSPCFERVCPYGHTNCLNDINVDDVFSSIIRTD